MATAEGGCRRLAQSHISHRVAVMYLGRIVELETETAVFEWPAYPYTKVLIAAVPEPTMRNRRNHRLEGGAKST